MSSLKRYRKSLLALADAIVRGSRKRKQTTGTHFTTRPVENRPDTHVLHQSCALGAAYEGAFGSPPVLSKDTVDGGDHKMLKRLRKRFRVLDSKVTIDSKVLGEDFQVTQALSVQIVELNDEWSWTRGRIARWLRRLAHTSYAAAR